MREAVTLHYIGDLSIEQIAHETNTPAGTIKARLHRGRAQLAAGPASRGVPPWLSTDTWTPADDDYVRER